MAFSLLCQKRDKLLISHQPMLLPKLPFTIGKLFTILESLPLCNSPAYSGWASSCRLFAISTGLDFVIFVAYIIEYVTTDCQVFTFYPFTVLIQSHVQEQLWHNWQSIKQVFFSSPFCEKSWVQVPLINCTLSKHL